MKIQALLLLTSLLFCVNCSVTSAKKVDPNTGVVSSFYNGAIGGKGGAVQGNSKTGDFIASYYDNEQSFRDAVIGATVSFLGHTVGSAVKAGMAADTAQHAASQATQQAQNAAAAASRDLATKGALIQAVPPEGGLQVAPIVIP
jgi:hypothetical protein